MRLKTHQKQSQISVQEAHRIWAKAQSRYLMINNLQFLSSFVHDKDFKYIINKLKDSYIEQANLVEKELKRFSIKSPEPNKTDVVSTGITEIASDKQIARLIHNLMKLLLSKCMKIIKEIVYNDNLREIFISITKDEVMKLYNYVKYLKLKGWIEDPPLYPNVKGKEIIAANEIWELWDHLYYRYLHIQLTKIYNSYVSDPEFSLILTTGITILEKQSKELEKLLINYGVNLPDKHPKNIPTPESKENFNDRFIFNIILDSMMNANTTHGFALMELVINEKLMDLFKELLFNEIYFIDKLIRYGKVKGWIAKVPVYRVRS
ncbi:MAG: DUF3231 family protein [Halanaerobiales bacterium]